VFFRWYAKSTKLDDDRRARVKIECFKKLDKNRRARVKIECFKKLDKKREF